MLSYSLRLQLIQLCKMLKLCFLPEVASESEADGVPSDQITVESSSNSTAVTDTSSNVLSFVYC